MGVHVTGQSVLTHHPIPGINHPPTSQNVKGKFWLLALQFQFRVVEFMAMEGLSLGDDDVVTGGPGNNVTQGLWLFGHTGIVAEDTTHAVLVYGTGEVHQSSALSVDGSLLLVEFFN